MTSPWAVVESRMVGATPLHTSADYYWSVVCHWGLGTYDYRGQAQGYARQLGWGPVVDTRNSPRKPCGSTA